MKRRLKSERGFTLVELGIVMAIIAILAAVAYPTYTGMRKRAYISEAKAILQEIRVDVWASYVEDTTWPAAADVNVPADTTNWHFAADASPTATAYEITATGKTGTPVNGVIVTLTLDDVGAADFSES